MITKMLIVSGWEGVDQQFASVGRLLAADLVRGEPVLPDAQPHRGVPPLGGTSP